MSGCQVTTLHILKMSAPFVRLGISGADSIHSYSQPGDGGYYNACMIRLIALLAVAPLLYGQGDDIREMLARSEAAWNRGDLAAFAADYEDAPTTTFVGREVTRGGVQAILARYQRGYPTPEARGKLTYSEIEVRQLGDGYALALGRFSLRRPQAGGGDAAGRFTLVLKRTTAGWKIIHDHSS